MLQFRAYLRNSTYFGLLLLLGSSALAGDRNEILKQCILQKMPIISPVADKIANRILNAVMVAERKTPVRQAAFMAAEEARRELRTAETKPIAEFFPKLIQNLNSRETPKPIVDPESLEATAERVRAYAQSRIEAPAAIPPEEFQPFVDEFMRVLALHRTKYDGTTGSKAFKSWARKEISRYSSQAEMERILRNQDDLRSFIRLELGDKFEILHSSENSWWNRVVVPRARHPWIKAIVRNPYLAAGGKFSSDGVRSFARVIRNALAVGTLPLYVNAYTNPIQQPVLQIVSQKGVEHTAFIAIPEQKWLIDVDVAKLLVGNLKAMVNIGNIASLKGKSPDVAEKQLKANLEQMRKAAQPLREFMAKDESNYQRMLKLGIELQTRASGFLPGNQASGRGQVWGSMIFWPTDISTRLIAVDGALTAHEHFEFDMQNRMEELKKDPKRNAARIKELQLRIDQENKRIDSVMHEGASVVAVWMYNEFVFPEYTKKWVSETDEQALTRVYTYMKKNLQFDYFLDRFGPEANKVLDGIGEEIRLREIGVSSQLMKEQQEQQAQKP